MQKKGRMKQGYIYIYTYQILLSCVCIQLERGVEVVVGGASSVENRLDCREQYIPLLLGWLKVRQTERERVCVKKGRCMYNVYTHGDVHNNYIKGT